LKKVRGAIPYRDKSLVSNLYWPNIGISFWQCYMGVSNHLTGMWTGIWTGMVE